MAAIAQFNRKLKPECQIPATVHTFQYAKSLPSGCRARGNQRPLSSASTLAAQMKSFSVRPFAVCVHQVIDTVL